jgi:hypothetical protein
MSRTIDFIGSSLRYQISIQAGALIIHTRREDMPLETLIAFASRQNPKRGFLFVSKVLGKHIPCRPYRMREVYQRLAEKLWNLPGPVVVLGMAETATGLGGGVAHSLAELSHCNQVLYLHTTRHRTDAPILLTFDELHSHATRHLLYSPQGERAALFKTARSLVLVDDEISTGKTLKALTEGIAHHLPQLQHIVLTAIVNWLKPAEQQRLQKSVQPRLGFASLLEGEFEFQSNPDYQPTLPAGMNGRQSSHYARADTGRTGLMMPVDVKRLTLNPVPEDPIVVVGTGEFAFAPFLLAEDLEKNGHDVLFQSTTRSPIMEGEAIRSKLTFSDERDEGVVNYLYNLPVNRHVIIAYEHPTMVNQHKFPAMVNGQTCALD